ncbi:MAG: M20/M25/M40 family metallo-hydrolase [Candidatus Sericytochromatia bacterium]
MNITSLLEKIVSINSIFPNEKELSEFTYNYLRFLGFKLKSHPISENRFNVLAEKGKGDISYLLYAHTDTVPIYGNWLNDPFKLRVEGDKAIGLGTADMKGGIVAILKAVENFTPKNYKLKVAFAVDEENYSEGAYQLSQTNWLDDVKGVLVPESAIASSNSANAGSTISIGRKGRVVYLLKIYGKSAHGVEPQKGVNAINQASKLIIALENFETEESEMGTHTFFVRSVNARNDSLSIPDYLELELDCHLVDIDNSDSFMNKVNNFIQNLYEQNILIRGDKDFSIEKISRPTPFLEPFAVDKKSNFLEVATQCVSDIYGQYHYNYGQSVADENIFGSLKIPTLTIGVIGDNHHSAEEWVSIKSIEKLTEIYKLILERLDKLHEKK